MDLVPLRRSGAPRRAQAGESRRLRTLLVELPFKNANLPSIGLSLLKASLERAGYPCTVRYLNVEFAALVGFDVYRYLSSELPEDLLLGDIIFAPAIDQSLGRFETLRERGPLFLREGSPLGQVPDWLWQRLLELQQQAASFVASCAAELARQDAEVIGFSCMFQTLPSLAVAKALKALAPDKTIVFGGPHCEGEMGLALHEAYPFIDFVGRGEGEVLLVELLAALSGQGLPLAEISGLVYRDHGQTRHSGEAAARIADLDNLPRPSYEDWYAQLRHLAPALAPTELELPLEASRGCWYGEKHHCTFCGLNGQTMSFRSKSAARVLEEIRGLDGYGTPFITAVDLIFDHRYFETLLPALAEDQSERCIFFETKANLTRRQLELLARARVRMIQPGIESLSTPVLTLMRKGVSAYQNVRLLKWSAELGIAVFWALLYGFPGEDPADYQRLAELVPALVHLAPPLGARAVRVDRFSPLFFDASLGITSARPAPAYSLIHAVAPEQLRRLAFHFEPTEPRRFDYVEPVGAALGAWHETFGRASFTSLTRGEVLHLYDRRPGATVPEARLAGLARAVYLACDAGATAKAVAKSVGAEEAEVERTVAQLTEQRWLAALDGRYLSLAVSLDGTVPAALPEALLPAVCHSLYCERVRSLGRFLPDELHTSQPQGGSHDQQQAAS